MNPIEMMYRMMEVLDGEKGIEMKIIPYPIATKIKLLLLRWL